MVVLAEASATICPLLDAVPKSSGSNGMVAIGVTCSAAAKSSGLISGRFGTPTWFRISFGGASFGRACRSRSTIALAFLRLARSGTAVIDHLVGGDQRLARPGRP